MSGLVHHQMSSFSLISVRKKKNFNFFRFLMVLTATLKKMYKNETKFVFIESLTVERM